MLLSIGYREWEDEHGIGTHLFRLPVDSQEKFNLTQLKSGPEFNIGFEL